MIGTLQQMKREDVQVNLNEEQKGLKRSLELRRSVHRFTLRNESHPLIRNLKIQFTAAEKMSWQEYWRRMTNGKPDMLWADGWFIQLTAWYLEMTFFIMDTTCPKDMPYIIIPGDFGSGESNVLLLGLKPPIHYQSLLWDIEESQESLEEEGLQFDPFDLLDGKDERELEFDEGLEIEKIQKDEEKKAEAKPDLNPEEGLDLNPLTLEVDDGCPKAKVAEMKVQEQESSGRLGQEKETKEMAEKSHKDCNVSPELVFQNVHFKKEEKKSIDDQNDDFELPNINFQANTLNTKTCSRNETKKGDSNTDVQGISCPICNKSVKKSLIQHINKSKKCNVSKEFLLTFAMLILWSTSNIFGIAYTS